MRKETRRSSDGLDKRKIAALLHYVGKIGVDDRVLKKPGSLTPEEIRHHEDYIHHPRAPDINAPGFAAKVAPPGIELHHEHMDGLGYPDDLCCACSVMARIIAVADTLDAMTTNRPDQLAMDLEYALGRIKALARI